MDKLILKDGTKIEMVAGASLGAGLRLRARAGRLCWRFGKS